MFKTTPQECCEQFFPNKSCEVYDTGCSGGGSAPEPTPGPPSPPSSSCAGHGWHVHREANDGCTDDDNIVEAWLQPYLKDQMFYPSSQGCCDKFFPTKDCKVYPSACGGPAPVEPTPGPPIPSSSNSATNFFEDFEGGDLSLTKFETRGIPWRIDEEFVFNGAKSVKNSVTKPGQSSKLILAMDFPADGLLIYELRHDVFMPWAKLEVKLDEMVDKGFQGHTDAAKWETQKISVTKGLHEIVWDVNTMNVALPPNQRGSSTVWIDDVRFFGTLTLDWEDNEFDDNLVSFSGIGKWRIDDSLPGPKTGVSAHSPNGLLPGEHSTMEIKWYSPSGGLVTFDCHVGLGTISFYIDDTLEYTEDQPGKGTQTVDTVISPGEHTFSWKYEPPEHANMPMSMVWIDNVEFAI